MNRNSRKHWQPGQTRPETREDRINAALVQGLELVDFTTDPKKLAKEADFRREFAEELSKVGSDEFGISRKAAALQSLAQSVLRNESRPISDPNSMPQDPIFDPELLKYQAAVAKLEANRLVVAAKTTGHRATVTDITTHDMPIPQEVVHDTQEPPLTA